MSHPPPSLPHRPNNATLLPNRTNSTSNRTNTTLNRTNTHKHHRVHGHPRVQATSTATSPTSSSNACGTSCRIAAIVLTSCAFVLLVSFAVFAYMRHRRQRKQSNAKETSSRRMGCESGLILDVGSDQEMPTLPLPPVPIIPEDTTQPQLGYARYRTRETSSGFLDRMGIPSSQPVSSTITMHEPPPRPLHVPPPTSTPPSMLLYRPFEFNATASPPMEGGMDVATPLPPPRRSMHPLMGVRVVPCVVSSPRVSIVPLPPPVEPSNTDIIASLESTMEQCESIAMLPEPQDANPNDKASKAASSSPTKRKWGGAVSMLIPTRPAPKPPASVPLPGHRATLAATSAFSTRSE